MARTQYRNFGKVFTPRGRLETVAQTIRYFPNYAGTLTILQQIQTIFPVLLQRNLDNLEHDSTWVNISDQLSRKLLAPDSDRLPLRRRARVPSRWRRSRWGASTAETSPRSGKPSTHCYRGRDEEPRPALRRNRSGPRPEARWRVMQETGCQEGSEGLAAHQQRVASVERLPGAGIQIRWQRSRCAGVAAGRGSACIAAAIGVGTPAPSGQDAVTGRHQRPGCGTRKKTVDADKRPIAHAQIHSRQ